MIQEGCRLQLACSPVQKVSVSTTTHLVPDPIYFLSYLPRLSAGHWYLCHCLHYIFWFYSSFSIIVMCAHVYVCEIFFFAKIWYTCKNSFINLFKIFLKNIITWTVTFFLWTIAYIQDIQSVYLVYIPFK